LERAFEALRGKRAAYDRLFNYYDGTQPVTYTANRLKEIFQGLDAVFTENWCSVVIDAMKDRINLTGFEVPMKAKELWVELWEGSQLKLESDEVHEAALVTGEGFVIAWPDEEGRPEAFANDPRLVHVFYEAGNPRMMELAAKWWMEGDKTRLNLYYEDRIEYYEGGKDPSSANSFRVRSPGSEDNPYGQIPVFHFKLHRRNIYGDLQNVVPIQNGINKLLADMMVAAEYGAFKQRYIISNADSLGKMKNAPNEIWDLPAGDGIGQQTQAGQFDATPLDNYLKAIDNLSLSVSSITRTPKHYFFSIGSNLSGEALSAMEAPLNKKAEDRIDRFAPVWRDLGAFMLRIAGVEVEAREMKPVFDKPEIVQPFSEAQAIQMMVSAGIPLETAVRRMKWKEEEVEGMMRDKREEEAAGQRSLAGALLEAERKFNAGLSTDLDHGLHGLTPKNVETSKEGG
jgi:hypothetical protein